MGMEMEMEIKKWDGLGWDMMDDGMGERKHASKQATLINPLSFTYHVVPLGLAGLNPFPSIFQSLNRLVVFSFFRRCRQCDYLLPRWVGWLAGWLV
jgi:hypothetical protein